MSWFPNDYLAGIVLVAAVWTLMNIGILQLLRHRALTRSLRFTVAVAGAIEGVAVAVVISAEKDAAAGITVAFAVFLAAIVGATMVMLAPGLQRLVRWQERAE